MKLRPKRFLAALLFVLANVGAPAAEYPVTGVVRAILSPEEVVIAHDAIPGFMPAMTMAFTLQSPLAKAEIGVGDVVEGVIVAGDGPMLLSRLRKTGEVATEGGAKKGGAAAAPRATRHKKAPPTRFSEGDRVPEFTLINQHGQATDVVSPERPTLITFIFTRCPVPEFCPLLAERFVALQSEIAVQRVTVPLRLLSVTLDPDFDTPAILSNYGDFHQADPSIWEFATGEAAEIDGLVRAFRVFRERNGALLDHTLCTALIDAEGTIQKIWRGNGWTIEEVVLAANALAPTHVARH